MSKRNPQDERFAPGDDPVPDDQQIPDHPSDSAQWAFNDDAQGYPEPLFPDDPDQDNDDDDPTAGGDRVVGADQGEQEATNG